MPEFFNNVDCHTRAASGGAPSIARTRASVPIARRDAARQCGRGSKDEYVVANYVAPVRFRPSAPNHSACHRVRCGLACPCTSTALALPCKQEICVQFTARAPESPLSFKGQDAVLRTRRWTFNSSRRRQLHAWRSGQSHLAVNEAPPQRATVVQVHPHAPATSTARRAPQPADRRRGTQSCRRAGSGIEHRKFVQRYAGRNRHHIKRVPECSKAARKPPNLPAAGSIPCRACRDIFPRWQTRQCGALLMRVDGGSTPPLGASFPTSIARVRGTPIEGPQARSRGSVGWRSAVGDCADSPQGSISGRSSVCAERRSWAPEAEGSIPSALTSLW